MKKFPSLIRLPSNKRFEYEPRHYDPVKEDIENRIAVIKSEMGQSEEANEYKSGISGAFKRNYGGTTKSSVGLIQLVAFTVLLGGFVGWIFYGNLVLYILMAFIPVYFFLRLRGRF